VERLRLNKEFKFSEDFKQKEILNEYGNYDKYFDNYKTVREKEYDSDDDGESRWEMKYNELQEKYNNPVTNDKAAKYKKSVEEKIKEDMDIYGNVYTFSDYMQMRKQEDQKNLQSTNPREEEKDEEEEEEAAASAKLKPFKKKGERVFDYKLKYERKILNRRERELEVTKEMSKMGDLKGDLERYNQATQEDDATNCGRVSPWCKEEIYRNYLEGWTVKDLSYKYGLLPERVKAIVFFRELFWTEIYPKIGESGLRRRLELSLEFSKEYPYVDYGKDLDLMALREQGMKLRKVTRGEIDAKPTKDIEQKISPTLKKIKPKSIDHVPLKFVGKGPSGYLIKEMNVRTGQGSKRVSFMFRKYCYYKDLYPNMLPEHVIEKKQLGPRIATFGHRF
jgi:hypothetical protein